MTDKDDENKNEIEKIRSFLDGWITTIEGDDFEGWLNLFTEDAVTMSPDSPAKVGKEAIREHWRPFGKNNYMFCTLSEQEIVIDTNYAFVRMNFLFKTQPKSGGGMNPESKGVGLWILQKQVNKAWKIARYMFTNTPALE